MKRILVLALLCLPVMVLGQKNINVVYAFRTYHSPNANYAEINTSIEANTLRSTTNAQGYFGKQAELTTIICNINTPDSAIYADKRVIRSPYYPDSNDLNAISLQDMQRIGLENGKYVVYFEIKDYSTTDQPMKYRDLLTIDYPQNAINVADLMLVSSYEKTDKTNIYSKNGYDLHPYLFDVIKKDSNILHYYTEIYNADKEFGKGNYYAIVTCIEDINSGKKIETTQTIKRQKAESLTPYLASIDISSLYEGSYYLTVEVRNEKNILYAYKRYPFFKQSDKKQEIVNADIPADAFVNQIADSNLKEEIKCLRPIAGDNYLHYIIKESDRSTPAQDRYFLYQFYKELNPTHPEKAYEDYAKQVKFVNDKYSTPIKKGYETDMGRVLLVYGSPNDIIDEKFGASSGFDIRTQHDKNLYPDSQHMDAKGVNYYPYQIWIYEHTRFGESNRKFVFYAKQNNLIEYTLLHSNAKGEPQDIYWENVLSQGTLEQGVIGKAGRQFQRGHE